MIIYSIINTGNENNNSSLGFLDLAGLSFTIFGIAICFLPTGSIKKI